MILGAGAVGGWIGLNMMRAGHDVVFVGRETFCAATRVAGLTARVPAGAQINLTPIVACASVDAAFAHTPRFDAVALCTKAYGLDAALEALQPHNAACSQVICFQNGIGAEARATALFGARVIAGTLTSPVSQTGPGVIALDKSTGGLGLAATDIAGREFARDCARAISTEYMPAHSYPNAAAMKWSKLMLNIVANASAAIFEMDGGRIYRDPALFKLEMRMVRECLAVMRASGIPVINLPGIKPRTLARAVSLLPDFLLQPLLTARVVSGRGGKRPGLYEDLAQGRSQNEVAWLNGAIAAQGARVGVPTPVNDWLAGTLSDCVAGRRRALAVLRAELAQLPS